MPPLRKVSSLPARFRLSITAALSPTYVPFLRRHLRAAHAALRPPLRELSVALVGDRRMAELHEQFLHITGPTDVLTFPLETDSLGRVTAGEVVVCVPEARRRARVEGVPVERELLLYALHGMLHLAGFDDRTAPDFATMHRTEDDILTRLGVGPVFSAPRGRVGKGGAPFKTIETSGRARRLARRPTMGGPATPSRRAPEGVRPARRAGKAAGPNGTEGRRP